MLGLANPAATLTVTADGNSNNPYRKGEYFHQAVTIANDQQARWENVSVTGVAGGTNATPVNGKVFLLQDPEAFQYDNDGNLTQDGRWDYTWDGESRLVRMTGRSDISDGAKLKLEFEYDFQGRRVGKKVFAWGGMAFGIHDSTRSDGKFKPSQLIFGGDDWGSAKRIWQGAIDGTIDAIFSDVE